MRLLKHVCRPVASFVIISCLAYQATAQLTQRVRGTVVDVQLQQPIEGATVNITSLRQSVTTGKDGSFTFQNVPVGTQNIQVTHVAYKEVFLDQIIVNSGKEVVLTVSMEEKVRIDSAVVVKTNGRRNKPVNELSLVSVRPFTVEETQRYAASVNDPLRMATGFAGVVSAEDGQNTIVIRGNSPTGLIWRMEGVDIPSPNHFGGPGSSGGGISILSSQLLSNSDFVTGAFAAEYGNGLSGVFDLHLRKGNNDHREYTIEAGMLGINFAAEGPFSKDGKGSYLMNYRYSTLRLLDRIGVTQTPGNTTFQDLSWNVNLPTNHFGTFGFFGFGGLSAQRFFANQDSSKWASNFDRYNLTYSSNTGAAGITHVLWLSAHTSLRSAISFSGNSLGEDEAELLADYTTREKFRNNFVNTRWAGTSVLNHRFSGRSSLRAGVVTNLLHFNFYDISRGNNNGPLTEDIDAAGNTALLQGFTQWQYKISEKITANSGFHYMQFLYNNARSLEPRLSIGWQFSNRSSIAAAYGLHSQLQGMGAYFAQQKNAQGNITYPNKTLGFTKAQHFVLSYSYLPFKDLRLKVETYYQQLFQVPISASDTSTFSTLNITDGYTTEPLVNKGKGRNYGVEFSFEKYLAHDFYCTATQSFYQSKYTAADGIERNTRFNTRHSATLIAGRDFTSNNRRRTFSLNTKLIYTGGFMATPIDLDKSVSAGYTVYNEQAAYTVRNPNYFRTDLRASIKWNRPHLTSTLSLDVQNVSNRRNLYSQEFDPLKRKVINVYQNGLIPVLDYKLEF